MEEKAGWFYVYYRAPAASRSRFFAEYGLHHSLPFYAGLGFLAGDYLKECSDLCIRWSPSYSCTGKGYILQRIREDGLQYVDDVLDRDSAPITRTFAFLRSTTFGKGSRIPASFIS